MAWRSVVGGIDDPGDVAVVEHDDAVGERQQLVEVLGDHEHPGPGGPALEQELLGGPHRGDVEAPARVGDDDQRRVVDEEACG